MYYEWGRNVKGSYAKITMEKYINKFVEGCENHTGSDIKVQKTPSDAGITLSKNYL